MQQDARSNRRSNKGFEADTAGFINQIKQNLAGYQSGFPVIRELVQNADDGGATHVKLVRLPPLVEADHPLFHSPGLMVLNNGRLRESDVRGIKRLGLGRKNLEKETIGKFGLGLKSVFHLCELFGFGASHLQSSSGQIIQERFCDILNPWSGLEHDTLAEKFDLWDIFSPKDQNLLLNTASALVDWERWFFVYLPLRRLSLCPTEETGEPVAITSNFAGDAPEQEFSRWWPGLCIELSKALPLLRHLQCLEQVEVASNGQQPKKSFHLKFRGDPLRTAFPEDLAKGKNRRFSGQFSFEQADSESLQLDFGGLEYHLPSPIFEQLREDSHWPKQPVLFTRGEKRLQSEDKNAPHAALYFVRKPMQAPANGFLRIQRASFLPVGAPLDEIPMPLPCQMDLIMHGFFFVDPSRSQIRLEPPGSISSPIANEEQLTQRWNSEIHHWIYVLLPAALYEYCQTIQADHKTVSALTSALLQSQVIQDNLAPVTTQRNFECRLGALDSKRALLSDEKAQTALVLKGKATASRWVLTSVGQALSSPISLPGDSYERMLDSFPCVHRLAETTAVLRPLEPRLAIGPARTYLTPSELGLLLESPEEVIKSVGTESARITTRGERFSNLATLFEQSWQHEPSQSWIADWTLAFLRLVMRDFTQERIHSVSSNLARMAELTRPTDRLFLRSEFVGGLDSIRRLNQQTGFKRCVLPSQFWNHQPPDSIPLGAQEVRACLLVLQGEAASKIDDQLIREVINHTQLHRSELWSQNRDLFLFAAIDSRTHKESRYNFDTLQRSIQEKRLFVRRDVHSELESAVTGALHPAHPSLLSLLSTAADLAFGNEAKLATCDAGAISDLLRERPLLGEQSGRAKLLVKLSERPWRSEFRNSYRYLVHGNPSEFDYEGPLWALRKNEAGSESWAGILATLLQRNGQGWKVADPEIAGGLSGDTKDRLGIQDADERFVSSELNRTPDLSALSTEQRYFLYLHISDDLLLQQIPLHACSDGTLVALDHQCFLDREYPLPPELRETLKLISPLPGSELQKRLSRLVPVLDPTQAAMLALRSGLPHRYAHFILHELQQMAVASEALEPELCQLLREQPWIPLLGQKATGFDRLLVATGDEESLRIFLSRFGGGYHSLSEVNPEIREHPVWSPLWEQFRPSIDTVYSTLANLLLTCPPLGDLSQVRLERSELTELLLSLPEELLPAGPLLKSLREHHPEKADSLMLQLSRACSYQTALQLYRWAQLLHSKTKNLKRAQWLAELSRFYLGEAAKHPEFEKQWPELPLLTEALTWRTSRELCYDSPSVESVYLLHPTYTSLLSSVLKQVEPTNNEPGREGILVSTKHGDSYTDCLSNLIRHGNWSSCQPEVVAALYALLAPMDPALQSIAEQLGRQDVAIVRGHLQLPGNAVCSYTAPGRSPIEVPFTIDLDIVVSARMLVANLLGEPISVELKRGTPTDLLLTPESTRPSFDGKRLNWRLQFRHFDPVGLDADQQAEIIWNTLWQIISRCYYHDRRSSLEVLKNRVRKNWEERILKAAQFDIRVAQKLIEDSLVHYLPMLPGKLPANLQQAYRRWQDLNRSETEAELSSVHDLRVAQGNAAKCRGQRSIAA